MITAPLRALKGAVIRTFLRLRRLRQRIALEIRRTHFADLHIVVPLSSRLSCPIPYNEAWHSFLEIFIQQDYRRAFDEMPLPVRWIDLGCHAGFFTAYVLMRRDQENQPSDWEALLVDADCRSVDAIARFAAQNNIQRQVHFWYGAISARVEPQSFVERAYMDSALADLNSTRGHTRTVPVVTSDAIIKGFPPPYDLIKVDIEGAEQDFFHAYREVLAAARFLLIEWHHWIDGGLSAQAVCELAARSQFRLRAEIIPAQESRRGAMTVQYGVLLFEKSPGADVLALRSNTSAMPTP